MQGVRSGIHPPSERHKILQTKDLPPPPAPGVYAEVLPSLEESPPYLYEKLFEKVEIKSSWLPRKVA